MTIVSSNWISALSRTPSSDRSGGKSGEQNVFPSTSTVAEDSLGGPKTLPLPHERIWKMHRHVIRCDVWFSETHTNFIAQEIPIVNASLLSKLTYSWITDLMVSMFRSELHASVCV